MSMKFIDRIYRPQKNIFASHHKIEKAYYVEQGSSLAITRDNKKIILAGTIYPSNDGNAIGVISNDYDVTDGDANVAVCIHGAIKVSAMPVEPTETAKTALKGAITFVDPYFLQERSITTHVTLANPGEKEITCDLLLINDVFNVGCEDPKYFVVDSSLTEAKLTSVGLRLDNTLVALTFTAKDATGGLKAGEIRVKPLPEAVVSSTSYAEVLVAQIDKVVENVSKEVVKESKDNSEEKKGDK